MQPSPPVIRLAALRKTFIQVAISLAVFGVLLILVLPTEWVQDPLFAVSAAAAVASAAVVLYLRVPVLPMTMRPEEARPAGVWAFRSVVFWRFIVADAGALIGMLFAFVLGTSVPYLVNGVVAIALLLLVVVPTPRRVRAAEARLDQAGARSGLAAELGV